MRTFLAWLVGFVVVLCLGVGLTAAGEALGVPSSIDLDGPTTVTRGSGRYSYDEEVTSLQTAYGYASGAFAVVIALWAGQATYHRKLNAGFTSKGWFSFFAWLLALTILMVISVLIHLTFGQFHGTIAYYVRELLELAAVVGVGWASYQWYKNRVARLTTGDEA